MAIGPVQMLVLGFAEPNFTGKIAAELDRLREHEFVKIVDALVVNKDENGEITALQVSDLSQDEATEMGAIAGALIGFGYGTEEAVEAGAEAGAEAMADGHLIPEEDAWYVADAIPNGSAAAIILLEHLWAIPLRDAIVDAGGIALADEWIHPEGSDRGRCRCRRRVGRTSGVRGGRRSHRPPRPAAVAERGRSDGPVVTERRTAEARASHPTRAELLRSRSYVVLLVLRRASSACRWRRSRTSSSRRSPKAQEYVFTTLPGELGFDSQPAWWPIPVPRAERACSSASRSATSRGRRGTSPPRDSRPSAPVQPIELPGIVDRVVRDAQPRRRARPRGAADRNRQRPGRARGAPGQARRAGDGERRDRRGRQLRRDQHPARLAARRRVPAHGGGRARGRDDGRRAHAGPARRRHRVAHLHRARRLDRLRDLLPRGAGHSRRSGAPTGAEFLWAIAIGVLAAIVGPASGARRCCSSRSSSAGWCS